MTFKNAEIYEGMKELVRKALSILDRSGFEYVEDLNIEVDINNIPPISFLLNDKIREQIYSKIEEIEETKEFAYVCDLVNKIPSFQSDFKLEKHDDIHQFRNKLGLVPPAEVETTLRKQQFKWDDLPHFLIVYCNLKKDLEFDEAIFNGVYKRFEEKMYGKNYIMALCPLKKFYLETDELVLDDEIKIRRISQGELSIINKWMSVNTLKKLDDIQFTIEYTYDENEFGNPQDADDWSNHFDLAFPGEKKFIAIVALLRLFKDGDCHNPLENFQVPFWANAGQGIHYNLCDRWIPGDRNYILEREEAEDFKEFYRKSLRFRDDGKMFIALERFNLAYEKKRFEDNIIDYVIALEALFGKKENKSRLGMRIGLKSGFLVGDSKEKITEIYKFMRGVYELRSSIVHGDEIKIPMKIGKEYYTDSQLKSAIIKKIREIIRCFFDGERFKTKKEAFAIIEEELKSDEKSLPKYKSGEAIIESVLDKVKRKRKRLGQPEHESAGVLK